MFSKEDYTIHQVVHFQNFGAERPNVSRLSVRALVISLSLCPADPFLLQFLDSSLDSQSSPS